MTYREDVTWLDLCNKLNQKETQYRIPETIKLRFQDIEAASEAQKSLATAIGYIRAGLGSGALHEDLAGFMDRIGCSTYPLNLPKNLLKCHVLDAWLAFISVVDF